MPLFRAIFRRERVERDLRRELEFHLQQETEANVRAGLSPDEARRAAERSFGGLGQVQEEVRDAWGVRLLDQLRQDFVSAWRGLRRNPGFTFAAGLTLVIGIGASTAMYSVVEAVLLRPLPYREPHRLVAVWSEIPRLGIRQAFSGYANIEDWRRSSHTLEGLTAWDSQTVLLSEASGETTRASAILVSPNFTELLGVRPILGRSFSEEEVSRREPLAVLSHRFWRSHFSGSADVLDRGLVIDGRPVRIIGVMPPGFYFPDPGTEIWLPESFGRGWDEQRRRRGTDSWRVVARLAPGVALAEARRELAGIASLLQRSYPADNDGLGIALVPLSLQATGRQLRLALFVLVGAVTAVLLIACSNVGNLLLARGATRRRELAIRAALGAGRRRLVAQLLVESALLGLLSAGLGAGLAAFVLHGLRVLGPGNIPRLDEVSLDAGALAFAVLLALASAIAAGLFPALGSTRRDTADVLRGAGRGFSEGRPARRLRSALVVAEVALAVVLLITAGLLSRSFVRLAGVDTGFTARRVLVAGMRFPTDRPEEQAWSFARQALERVRQLPGIAAAGIGEEVLGGEAQEQAVTVEGADHMSTAVARLPLRVDSVTPGYFQAVGMSLRSGRDFEEPDDATSSPVTIVNETFARRLWPDANPIGRRIRIGGGDSAEAWVTIVGIVGDVRRKGPDQPPVAQAFRPFAQRPDRGMNLVLATTAIEPSALARSVRAVVAEVDRAIPIYDVETLQEQLDRALAPRQFSLGLIGAFAAIALTLAGIGIFGVMNYSVTRRTQEIGIRMALGAQPQDVLRLVLGAGLRLALAGIVIGVAVAALATRTLAGLLYEISTVDPLSFAGAVAVLFSIALLACYLPARRAVSVNPVTALQSE